MASAPRRRTPRGSIAPSDGADRHPSAATARRRRCGPSTAQRCRRRGLGPVVPVRRRVALTHGLPTTDARTDESTRCPRTKRRDETRNARRGSWCPPVHVSAWGGEARRGVLDGRAARGGRHPSAPPPPRTTWVPIYRCRATLPCLAAATAVGGDDGVGDGGGTDDYGPGALAAAPGTVRLAAAAMAE